MLEGAPPETNQQHEHGCVAREGAAALMRCAWVQIARAGAAPGRGGAMIARMKPSRKEMGAEFDVASDGHKLDIPSSGVKRNLESRISGFSLERGIAAGTASALAVFGFRVIGS